MKAKVFITLKPSVTDPQGNAVKHSLSELGYGGVNNVRIGKMIELDLTDREQGEAEAQIDDMCKKLLSNPVIEDYRLEIVEG